MLNQPIQPMLLQKSLNVPTGSDYIHQFKWDGHRASLHYDRGSVTLYTRELNNCTIPYPEFQHINLPVTNCILDGECIVLDPDVSPPLPSFESIMTRFHARKESTIKQLTKQMPAHFVAWDILFLNDEPIHQLPLEKRLEILSEIVTTQEQISVTPSFADGVALFQNVVKIGGEGVVSKPKYGKYHFGVCSNRDAWYKTKNYQFATVQISGIRKKKFGWSLSLNGEYVGVLEFPPPLQVKKDCFFRAKSIITKETDDWYYVEPTISFKVKFQSLTKDGKLRSPSFVEMLS